MENQQATAQQKSLTLLNMSSAFLIFGLGITMATLVFLIELICKRIQDHYFIFDNKIYPCNVEEKDQSESDDGKDQMDANESSVVEDQQPIAEDTTSVSDDNKTVDAARISYSDDAEIGKVGMENVILVQVKIHKDDDVIAGETGGKPINRKPIRHENFDKIEIEELDLLIQMSPK